MGAGDRGSGEEPHAQVRAPEPSGTEQCSILVAVRGAAVLSYIPPPPQGRGRGHGLQGF